MTFRRTVVVIGLILLPLISWYLWTTSPSYWLKAKIEEHDAQEVWQFESNGRTAYYIVAGCCDSFNPVYSGSGKYICSPSGGNQGNGDEQCPSTALADPGTKITRIWPEMAAPGERLIAPPLDIPQPKQQDAPIE